MTCRKTRSANFRPDSPMTPGQGARRDEAVWEDSVNRGHSASDDNSKKLAFIQGQRGPPGRAPTGADRSWAESA